LAFSLRKNLYVRLSPVHTGDYDRWFRRL